MNMKFLKTSMSLLALTIIQQSNAATVTGLDATVFNSLIDPGFTGGVETAYLAPATATVTTSSVPEFGNFINFYDINIDGNSLEMTLVNNSDAAPPLALPSGKFDTYYFSLENFNITSVSLDAANTDAALINGVDVQLVSAGTVVNQGFAPDFSIDGAITRTLETDGFFVRFGEGADYSSLNVSAAVNFDGAAVPEPSAAFSLVGLSALLVLRRRK